MIIDKIQTILNRYSWRIRVIKRMEATELVKINQSKIFY